MLQFSCSAATAATAAAAAVYHSLELAEDVCVLRENPDGLQDGHSEGEDASDHQLVRQLLRQTFNGQLGVPHVTLQI